MKRSNFAEGDDIEVTTTSENIRGRVLPSQSEDCISIKLGSGYNLSIKKTEIKKTQLIKKHTTDRIKEEKEVKKRDLPIVSILHTGGTVASRVDYTTGAVSPQFSSQELIKKFPELQEKANIESRLISSILSSNIRFHNYNQIAKEIKKEIKRKVRGIIITHGTDTLHYTAAALSFILENLSLPVILVGAQRSSDRPSTDASLNLMHAVRFITETEFIGAAICMHATSNDESSVILPACKTRKMHASRRDAFKPINASPIAIIEKNIALHEKTKEKPKEPLKIKLINEKIKVGILKVHPNMYSSQVEAFKQFDAVIIEGTGLGHAPIEKIDAKAGENIKILNAIKKLAAKIPVIITSQCIFGRTNLDVYSYGRKLKEAGVINDHSDITTETAFIKAAWLLSNHKKEFYKLWYENMRGELNERVLHSQYLDQTLYQTGS